MTKPLSEDTEATIIGRNKFRVTRLETRPDSHGKFVWKVFGDQEVVTVGDGALIWAVPKDLTNTTLRFVGAFVTTAGAVTVQVRNVTQAVDMLSTPITIDAGELNTYTAAIPPAINTANDLVVTGDQIAVDVDAAAGSAMGLGVMMIFA